MANSDLREDILPKERLANTLSFVFAKGVSVALMGVALLYALGYL